MHCRFYFRNETNLKKNQWKPNETRYSVLIVVDYLVQGITHREQFNLLMQTDQIFMSGRSCPKPSAYLGYLK